jgi:transposase InsO family protein
MMSMLCNCCVRELLILARTWFAFGLPSKIECDTIVSDRGPQFVSKFWEELHKSLGTKLLHSSAYHPQTSG